LALYNAMFVAIFIVGLVVWYIVRVTRWSSLIAFFVALTRTA